MDKPIQEMTTQDLLNAVNHAIITILCGGQSYKLGSRQLTRADLKQLYSMRNNLIVQVATETNKNYGTFLAYFEGR